MRFGQCRLLSVSTLGCYGEAAGGAMAERAGMALVGVAAGVAATYAATEYWQPEPERPARETRRVSGNWSKTRTRWLRPTRIFEYLSYRQNIEPFITFLINRLSVYAFPSRDAPAIRCLHGLKNTGRCPYSHSPRIDDVCLVAIFPGQNIGKCLDWCLPK